MLVAERWNKIIQLVNERGSIRVSELSELCGVTEETIRRDLDRLETEGKLMRSHGGAMSLSPSNVQDSMQMETPYPERETENADQKQAIAEAAVALIKPNDRIILDPSSTAWYVAQKLPDIPLTVLTNSMKVAIELSTKEKIVVISTGGIMSARSLSFVGPLADRSLSQYHVDKAFISCKGLHVDKGLSEANELQAMVKQKMISIADQVYVLADYSKFQHQSLAHVADLDQVHTIITDSKTDRAILKDLQDNKGIQVITC